MVEDGAFSHKIDYVAIFRRFRISKGSTGLRNMVIAEGVNFAYWWIFSGGGSARNRATLSSCSLILLNNRF